MSATPHFVGRRDVGNPFPARWFGKCASCGDNFHLDDMVLYVDGQLCIDHECTTSTRTAQNHGEDLGSTMANRTMPRGANAAQRCSVCFIVPASNGVCGCS
jgi:hypothetical protein